MAVHKMAVLVLLFASVTAAAVEEEFSPLNNPEIYEEESAFSPLNSSIHTEHILCMHSAGFVVIDIIILELRS